MLHPNVRIVSSVNNINNFQHVVCKIVYFFFSLQIKRCKSVDDICLTWDTSELRETGKCIAGNKVYYCSKKEKVKLIIFFYNQQLKCIKPTIWLYCFGDVAICDLICEMCQKRLFASSVLLSNIWPGVWTTRRYIISSRWKTIFH